MRRLVLCALLASCGSAAVAGAVGHYLLLRTHTSAADISGTHTTLNGVSAMLGTQHGAWDGAIGMQYLRLSEASDTAQGMGDIYLHGGAVLLDEFRSPFELYASAAATIANADETRGLGSGENDYSV